jgi:hypothetical protein
MESVPVSNYVFGSVHDSSLYGLFAELILQNRQVPGTLLPYSTESIYYPQAFFIIEAFGHFVTGLHPAEITLRVTPLFMALSVLGAYYLGRQLGPEKHLGVSFAFVFFAVSRWPRLLAWGSNAFVAGFPLYFVCISLLLEIHGDGNIREILVRQSCIGILFGYLGAIHLVFLQSLFATIVVVVLFDVIKRDNREISKKILGTVMVLGCSVILISPYILTFVTSIPYLGHNIGLPSDVFVPSADSAFSHVALELGEIYRGFFASDWISPYRILKFETALLISAAVSIVFITKYMHGKRKLEFKRSVEVILASLVGSTLVLVVRGICMFSFPSLVLVVTNWAQTAILIFVSICFFICVFNFAFFQNIYDFISCRCKFPSSRRKVQIKVLTIIVLLSIYIPYLYYLFVHDLDYLTGQYNLFCVTTTNDLELMLWIKHNVQKEAIILINPGDSGAFIPVVSNIKVIYPFTYSRSSLSYFTLINSLKQNNLNEEVYDILEKLNISHIFIGEKAIYGYERFDPLLFLANPKFKLERQVGDSYLFTFIN